MLEAIKPNWFLSSEENLVKVGELLNNWEISWFDWEFLSSLEHSFYKLKWDILDNIVITSEEKFILNVYKKVLWWKCANEVQEIDKFITYQEKLSAR